MVHTLKDGTLLIYDTEWTSWPGFMESKWSQPGRYPEIIQIGAVKLDIAHGFQEVGAFQCFIRPKFNPELSKHIIALTGITQDVIASKGIGFVDALGDFVDFMGDDLAALMSFGRDGYVIQRNCKLHEIDMPPIFDIERNLRQSLLELELIDQEHVSSDLPSLFGLPDEDRSHDALSDARGLGKAIRHLRETGKL